MLKYLHIDVELGGAGAQYSLLTAYFMVTDDKFNVLGELDLAVKPDDGCYVLSGQGMRVNNINIVTHDDIAIPYKQAKPLLFNFLSAHSKSCRLTPVGHGVGNDIDHIIDKLISIGSWDMFCTYHRIDTSVILQFLRACGKIPSDIDGSVSALAAYFDIPIDGKLHVAKTDAVLTAQIYKKFVELGR